MAIHSSTLAWRIPWTEDPGWLQSLGLQRVGHNRNDLACTYAGQPRQNPTVNISSPSKSGQIPYPSSPQGTDIRSARPACSKNPVRMF